MSSLGISPRAPWAWTRKPLEPLPPASGDDPSRGPCLVHLVRKANGIVPLSEFAEAHRRHPPGVDHELVLLMKGFSSPADARPYLAVLDDLRPNAQYFPDRRLDIGAYFDCAARLRRDRYCFVNSNGRPQVDGWLAKLDAALALPGVGQVGATGSWGSQHSWLMYVLGLPSAYRGAVPPAAVVRRLLVSVELERDGKARRSLLDTGLARVRTVAHIPEALLGFEPFPAPHLRSSAFMVSHANMRRLRMFVVRKKSDAYSLECGRQSITRQLQRIGLTSLVVDRCGLTYAPERWHLSRTFFQGEQEGLLVADNQTALYGNGSAELRKALSALAWGRDAAPAAPTVDRAIPVTTIGGR